MGKQRRELVADWLIMVGGAALLVSLFLTWSHQFSPHFLAVFGANGELQGVPHDPTAWQLYSSADVLLAGLAVALVLVALRGNRLARLVVLGAAAIGLAFTLHALSTPPTNGANIVSPGESTPSYVSSAPGAGVGETVAIAGLLTAIAGLGLSFTAD
jgi:hypothetical protein